MVIKNVPTESSRHIYYSALSKYFTLINNNEVSEKYKVLLKEINKKIDDKPRLLKDNIKDVNYKKGKKDFIKKIRKNNHETTFGEFILSFYLLLPAPRRLKDYQNITYVESRKSIKAGNYILGKRTGKIKYFLIFKDFKTSKTMGEQKFGITNKDLVKVLDNRNLRVGDRIYDKSPKSFRTLLQKTTNIFFGTPLTNNDLRVLHSTSKFGNINVGELEKDSKFSGHSSRAKLKNYIRT